MLKVMVNGFPGNMAQEVAAAVLRRGWILVPYSLTGKDNSDVVEFEGHTIRLVGPSETAGLAQTLKTEYPDLISVDYTHPTAVNPNGSFYADNGLAFVMGTTGGDREKLMNEVAASGVYAVIAPNMSKPIVAFQSMIESMAKRYPGVFAGSTLDVVESHQSRKADTSGTAKAVVAAMENMGIQCSEEEIVKLRDEESQLAFGVPPEALGGHAFHTYAIVSADETTELVFQHNIVGRRTYAEGTCDAVAFLSEQRAEGSEKKVFNMIDVLEAGALA